MNERWAEGGSDRNEIDRRGESEDQEVKDWKVMLRFGLGVVRKKREAKVRLK